MPNYKMRAPDGNTYTIPGPEGATDEQVRAEILRQYPNAGQAQQQQGALDTALDIGKGAVKGVGQAVEAFPGAMASLMGAVGRGAESLGLGDPEEARKREQFRQQNPLPMLSANLPEPETRVGRYAKSVGEMVPATLASPGRALPLAAAALGGGIGAEAGGEIGGTPGRIIGGFAGAVAPGGVAAGVRHALQPETNVAHDLARAIQRDGTTAQQLSQALQEARRMRPDATLADVAGENVRGLVERVAQTPGAGRSTIIPALTERQQQQIGRISEDLTGLVGTRETAFEATQQTMAARAESAAPLYEQAYAAGDRAVWSPELEHLAGSDSVVSAMHGAVRAWRDNAIADGFGAMNPGAMVERGGIIKFTGGKLPAFPNLQFWDYTKRMMDDKVRTAIRAGQNQKARTLTELTAQLRRAIDREVPEFAAAREAWGGPSQYLEAIENGRNILQKNVSAEELRANLAAMTEAQREAYRIGAVSAIRGKMGNDPAKMADLTKYLRSPEVRQKVAAIMPSPERAREWERRLLYETRSSELVGRGLGGSQTARRLAEQQDAQSIVGDLVMSALAHGPTLGLLQRILVSSGGQRIRDTLRSQSDALLADALVGTGGEAQAALQGAARGAPQSMVPAGANVAAQQVPREREKKPLQITVTPQDIVNKSDKRSFLDQFNPIGSAAAMEAPGQPGDPLGKRPKFEQGGTSRGAAGGSLQDLRPAFDQVQAEQGGKISTVHIGDLMQRSNLPPSQVKDILREAAARGEVQLGFGNRARSALSPQQAKGIMKIGDEEFAVVTFKGGGGSGPAGGSLKQQGGYAFQKMREDAEAARAAGRPKEPLPEFKPKIGQEAYDEGFAHARRGIGRRIGLYDQENYNRGYFAGRDGPSPSATGGGRGPADGD